jgi:hypothetical protein
MTTRDETILETPARSGDTPLLIALFEQIDRFERFCEIVTPGARS